MNYETPNVYVEELSMGVPGIQAATTDIAGFVGTCPAGPTGEPTMVRSVAGFNETFGVQGRATHASVAVHDFFANGGSRAIIVAAGGFDEPATAAQLIDSLATLGVYAGGAPPVQLLCIPDMARRSDPFSDAAYADLLLRATGFCVQNRILLLVDPNVAADEFTDIEHWLTSNPSWGSANSALYFPRLHTPAGQTAGLGPVAASGSVAGVMARTDALRGVWKAPAGPDASLGAVVATKLSDQQQSPLNGHSVNLIRDLPGVGTVIWGARTGYGSIGDDFRYVQVRRTALFIEHSLQQGLQWAVFEPNGEPLWASIRQTVTDFLSELWRGGAFLGSTPSDGFFVRCGDNTMSRADQRRGRTVVNVGFAALRPAEFVQLSITLNRR